MREEPTLPILPADLTQATPPDIDAHLADFHARSTKIGKRIEAALVAARRAAGEKPTYVGRDRTPLWQTTAEEAVTAARAVAASDDAGNMWLIDKAKAALDSYDTAMADLYEVLKLRAPLDAEWRRRGGWSRFFEVFPERGSKDGHIHSSMNCKTCNRNGKLTDFGWHPDLSGLTEVAAVEKLGPKRCTVGFPSAPLEWTRGPQKPAACENAPVKEGTMSRPYGLAGTRYGDCTQCNATRIAITQFGWLRRHKPVN